MIITKRRTHPSVIVEGKRDMQMRSSGFYMVNMLIGNHSQSTARKAEERLLFFRLLPIVQQQLSKPHLTKRRWNYIENAPANHPKHNQSNRC